MSVLLTDAAFALASAVLLAIMFTAGFARSHAPMSAPWWLDVLGFFVLVFLATSAGRVWLSRTQPAIGMALPFAAGVVIALIFLVAPTMQTRRHVGPGSDPIDADPSGWVAATLFLVLMILLSVAIVFGVSVPRP